MNFQQRKSALVQLGEILGQEAAINGHPEFHKAYIYNNWFTEPYVKKAVGAWADVLNEHKLDEWLGDYEMEKERTMKSVAIIMAGNIPMVGFHDLVCVLICGHKAIVKLSSDDQVLMRWVIAKLLEIAPDFADQIEISESKLPASFDAVIATGSNNTNRYFEYYFRNKPSLLRGNRHSVAILTGNETPEDLAKLGADIFTYFGLGCRSVSKLFVPEGYDFTTFFESIEPLSYHIDHHKYASNYTYHKAILLMNLAPHLDNNFLLVKEDESMSSPLSVLFYEYYKTTEDVNAKLSEHANEIQCVLSKTALYPQIIPFGQSQQPDLWDYADGVDTIDFLQSL